MSNQNITLEILADQIYFDTRLTELEKCVVVYQIFTYVGNDEYDENIKHYKGTCDRKTSEQFIKENATSIDIDY